jgi:DNA-binding response OmpR family regulator
MALSSESNAALHWHAEVRAPLSDRRLMPRVLVAHTDKSMRQLLKLQLVCAGYDVIVAENAAEASEAMLRQPPDAIVLDAGLPNIDGLEFISSPKPDAEVPLIPVIFLTPREAALERARRLGAIACLTTPLHTEELLEAVARCIAPAGEAGSRMGFRPARAA